MLNADIFVSAEKFLIGWLLVHFFFNERAWLKKMTSIPKQCDSERPGPRNYEKQGSEEKAEPIVWSQTKCLRVNLKNLTFTPERRFAWINDALRKRGFARSRANNPRLQHNSAF